MKTMKKLFTLALVLMMVMSLALPTLAASDGKYTITINGSKSNQVAGSSDGHTYEAYQILTGTLDDTQTNLGDPQWGANINAATFLAALKADNTFGAGAANVFSSVTTAKEFAAEIAKSTFGIALLEHMAQIMHAHLTGTPHATTTETKAPYTMKVSAGYYLIKDKSGSLAGKENKDYTDLILHVSQDIDVYHKGSVPTVAKTVSEHNSQYGESVEVAMQKEYYYKLVGTLPSDFDDYSSYSYKFVDTMGAGIEFAGIERIFAVHDATDTEEVLSEKTATHDGYVVTAPAEGSNVLTIYFENLKHDDKHAFAPGDKIIVIYKAKLTAAAVVGANGNKNEVYLEYSNNPNGTGTGKTTSDRADAYTFGLKVNKIDGKTKEAMEGVTFKLYREIAQSTATTGSGTENHEITYIKEYAVVTNGAITAWTQVEANATVLSTNKDGVIAIAGLDTNVNYYLKEIATLSGYNTILDPINIYLTAEMNANGEVTTVWMNGNTYVSDLKNYEVSGKVLGVEFNVPNYMGDILPSTGGVGTTMFYVFGSVLVLGAILMLVTKRRMA